MANTPNVQRLRIPGCRPGHEPYELSPPAEMAGFRDWRALPVEERQRQEQSWSARMKACISWAEEHGVRLGPRSENPDWLLKATARRDYQSRPAWLDHPLCWVQGRRPAAITSSLHPYMYEHEHQTAIREWLADKPDIGLATGPGWYYDETIQIVLWRRDVLGDDVTAADAGPEALGWVRRGADRGACRHPGRTAPVPEVPSAP
ncbi:hypothetical protein ACU686_13345 [Yinghuangia aomiensis]